MNHFILDTEIQEFINENIDADVSKLILKGTAFSEVSTKEIVEQIEAKKKCKDKLSTWFDTQYIYYPNKLNIEQTSSEIAAIYKASLVSGNTILDVTGGFGVDSYYFSKVFKHVVHCEIDSELSNIVVHNMRLLNVNKIKCISGNGLDYLKKAEHVDWIYIDPSRRNDTKKKVFFLNDCLPNVPEHLKFLLEKSDQIMIKTSPLLDLSIGLKELTHVAAVHIIAIKNDVKELLWILKNNHQGKTKVTTVNFKTENKEAFSFNLDEELTALPSFSKPLTYLYEPNSALLKSGAFKLVSVKLGIDKLHTNTHLYTSDKLIDFPGRRFKIEKIVPYNKQLLKKELLVKANISIRNFPKTVEQIRKKYGIKEGGSAYLFFTTNTLNEKIVLLCSKAV